MLNFGKVILDTLFVLRVLYSANFLWDPYFLLSEKYLGLSIFPLGK